MNIIKNRVDDVTVLDIQGVIKLGESAREFSIWRRPASAPTVQTLLAAKSGPALAGIEAPMVSSEAPYMGDESTSRPPASKNARRISPRARRAAASVTSKVIHVPKPTGGKRSPEDGIGRAAAPG